MVRPELEALIGDSRPALRILFAAVILRVAHCLRQRRRLAARPRFAPPRGDCPPRRSRCQPGRDRPAGVVESLLLSFFGGALGLALSTLFLKSMVRFIPQNLPRLDTFSVDPTVLAFTILASVRHRPALRSRPRCAHVKARSVAGSAGRHAQRYRRTRPAPPAQHAGHRGDGPRPGAPYRFGPVHPQLRPRSSPWIPASTGATCSLPISVIPQVRDTPRRSRSSTTSSYRRSRLSRE